MYSVQLKDLHKKTTVPSNGEPIMCWDASRLLVQISTDSTSFEIVFQASLDGTNYFKIAGNKTSDISAFHFNTTTIEDGCMGYDFDISPYRFFRSK